MDDTLRILDASDAADEGNNDGFAPDSRVSEESNRTKKSQTNSVRDSEQASSSTESRTTVIHSTTINENHVNIDLTSKEQRSTLTDDPGAKDITAEPEACLLHRCSLELKKRYRRDVKKIHPVSWLRDIELDLLRLYVPHSINDDTNNKKYTNGVLEVFETTLSALPRRIIVRGETGSGRRLLSTYLALVWATDEDNISSLSFFKCVILLTEDDLRSGSIKDAIIRILSCGLPDIDKEKLWSDLLKHSEEVMLIICGYEKFKERHDHIDRFLVDDELANFCIFVTCSSHREPSLPTKCSRKILSLHKFTAENAEQCIRNYYVCRNEHENAADDLLHWFRSKDEIRELSLCPLYNAMLCIMFDKEISSVSMSSFAITGVILERVLEAACESKREQGKHVRERLERLAYDSFTEGEGFSQERMERMLQDQSHLSISMRSGLLRKRNSILNLKQVSTYAFEMNQTKYYLAASFIAKSSMNDFEEILIKSVSCMDVRRMVGDSFKLAEPTQAKAKIRKLLQFWGKHFKTGTDEYDSQLEMCALAWNSLKGNEKYINSRNRHDLDTGLVRAAASALPAEITIKVVESRDSENNSEHQKRISDDFLITLIRHDYSSCTHLKLHISSDLTAEEIGRFDPIFRGKGSLKSLTIVSPVTNYDAIKSLLQHAQSTKVALYLTLDSEWSFCSRREDANEKERLLNFILSVVSTTSNVKRVFIGVGKPITFTEKETLKAIEQSIRTNKSLGKLFLATADKQSDRECRKACGKLKNIDFFVANGMTAFEDYVSSATDLMYFC